MHRSEGINVALAAILLGIGAVILGLLAPTAAVIVGAVCAAAGLYLLGGVYVGWWLPTTAVARAFQARLVVVEAHVRKVTLAYFVVHLNVKNEGREDVADALVNFVVPDFVEEVKRCTPEGDVNVPEHKGAFWREDERFWNGNVSFPGGENRLIFFRVVPCRSGDFRARLTVASPALERRFEHSVNFTLGEAGG